MRKNLQVLRLGLLFVLVASAMAGEQELQRFQGVQEVRKLFSAPGQRAGSHLGEYVDGVGDQNGDGYADILASAPGDTAVYLYFGGPQADSLPDLVWKSSRKQCWAGQRAGDVNGDGAEDIMILTTKYPSGAVEVFYGGTLLDTIPDVVMIGHYLDAFGTKLAAGDLNGDGYKDIAVGAENYPQLQCWGKVYVYFGGSPMDSVADWTLAGHATSDRPLLSGSGGDLNGDGFADVILSRGVDINTLHVGQTEIYLGGALMDTIPDLVVTHAYGDSIRLYGGGRIVGDLNGDGYDDWYGGREIPGPYGRRIPEKYIFYGGHVLDGRADIRINEWNLIWNSGGRTEDAGDVNHDGYDDLIVGDAYDYGGFGKVVIYLGGRHMDGHYDFGFTGYNDPAYDGAGRSVARCGDFDGDGVDDILFGAWGEPFNKAGRVMVFSGDSTKYSNNAPEILRVEPPPNSLHTIGLGDTLLFKVVAVDYDTTSQPLSIEFWVEVPIGPNRYVGCYGRRVDSTYVFRADTTSVRPPWGCVRIGKNRLSCIITDHVVSDTLVWTVIVDTTLTAVQDNWSRTAIPQSFLIEQNYPNPFNATTRIRYRMPKEGDVTLTLYDVLGREVTRIAEKHMTAGNHTLVWDARDEKGGDVPSGVYICELKIEHHGRQLWKGTRKLVVMR